MFSFVMINLFKQKLLRTAFNQMLAQIGIAIKSISNIYLVLILSYYIFFGPV